MEKIDRSKTLAAGFTKKKKWLKTKIILFFVLYLSVGKLLLPEISSPSSSQSFIIKEIILFNNIANWENNILNPRKDNSERRYVVYDTTYFEEKADFLRTREDRAKFVLSWGILLLAQIAGVLLFLFALIFTKVLATILFLIATTVSFLWKTIVYILG